MRMMTINWRILASVSPTLSSVHHAAVLISLGCYCLMLGSHFAVPISTHPCIFSVIFRTAVLNYAALPKLNTNPIVSCSSLEWQSTGIYKSELPSTSQTAAARHWILLVVNCFTLPVDISWLCHVITTALWFIGRFLLLVRWPGTTCSVVSGTWLSALAAS